MVELVSKPWGWEKWIETKPLVLKEILTKSGFSSSIHVHKIKWETNYVIGGRGKVYTSLVPLDLDKFLRKEYIQQQIDNIIYKMECREVTIGDSYTILPGFIHKVEAVEDLHTIESSTPEVDDVVRIKDSYGRGDGRIEVEHVLTCKRAENLKTCPCQHPGCKRKGICCECLRHHLSKNELPRCCFPSVVRDENGRSFDTFIWEWTVGKAK